MIFASQSFDHGTEIQVRRGTTQASGAPSVAGREGKPCRTVEPSSSPRWPSSDMECEELHRSSGITRSRAKLPMDAKFKPRLLLYSLCNREAVLELRLLLTRLATHGTC